MHGVSVLTHVKLVGHLQWIGGFVLTPTKRVGRGFNLGHASRSVAEARRHPRKACRRHLGAGESVLTPEKRVGGRFVFLNACGRPLISSQRV